jgi:ubiquitin C-terminal hydrolase
VLEVASTSRLLSFEGSDDDCQVVVTNDAPSHPPPDSNVLQLQRDGSSSSSFYLVGNVMHTGRTLNSGHYYADVRCNGSWIRVNDTSVQHIEWDHCRLQSPSWSHMAYVQIYSCSSNHLQAAQVLEPRK